MMQKKDAGRLFFAPLYSSIKVVKDRANKLDDRNDKSSSEGAEVVLSLATVTR